MALLSLEAYLGIARSRRCSNCHGATPVLGHVLAVAAGSCRLGWSFMGKVMLSFESLIAAVFRNDHCCCRIVAASYEHYTTAHTAAPIAAIPGGPCRVSRAVCSACCRHHKVTAFPTQPPARTMLSCCCRSNFCVR